MSVFGVLGVAVLAVTAGAMLKQHSAALGLCLSVAAGVFLLLACVGDLKSIISSMQSLLSQTNV